MLQWDTESVSMIPNTLLKALPAPIQMKPKHTCYSAPPPQDSNGEKISSTRFILSWILLILQMICKNSFSANSNVTSFNRTPARSPFQNLWFVLPRVNIKLDGLSSFRAGSQMPGGITTNNTLAPSHQ